MFSPYTLHPADAHNVRHLLTRQLIGNLIRRICCPREIENRALGPLRSNVGLTPSIRIALRPFSTGGIRRSSLLLSYPSAQMKYSGPLKSLQYPLESLSHAVLQMCV